MSVENYPMAIRFFAPQDVLETYNHGYSQKHMGTTNFTMIVKAVSGREGRWHVYRVDQIGGTIRCIGDELDILYARAVARRPLYRDGLAITDQELKVGRWTFKRWRREQPLYPP